MGEEKEKILILRPFFGKRHFVWPPLLFLWCGCLAFKKGSYWSHLFHPVVIVVQSEKWTTLYECEIGLDFWRIWWCWWCFTKFMTNILWIHFLLMCFHGKLVELTLFLWNSSYFERNIDFWCLLTQLEFNDFRIQSHQIWHDICTFMHDQKNPSIGLWEKNPQWSKQRFRCWKNNLKGNNGEVLC